MKDKRSVLTPDDLSQDQWLLLLWSFITDIPETEWNEFSNDLIYTNRFSSSHKVVEVIKSYSERCTTTIKKGRELYRARIYHKDPLRNFLSEVFLISTGEKVLDNPGGNIDDYYNMKLAALMMEVQKGSSRGREIIDAYNKWQKRAFKGYDSANSGAPPAQIVTAGRINPEKIRYLYLAEDWQTAAYEVRPTIGQYVSVATFKIEDDMKIYDLAQDITSQRCENFGDNYALFSVIQRRFSDPNTGDTFRYLPTQFLGEMIKQMGFEGLRFKSSLKNGGINVVLFDDRKCTAVSSDLTKVSEIELKFDNPDIYQLEEYLKVENNNEK